MHYVAGRNSIDEAIRRLRDDDFPAGVNAVIFLLHKPAGLGSRENVLTVDGPRVAELFSLIDAAHPFRVGMDSCTVPGAVRFCRGILPESLDTCEGARFSCYIGPDMVMVPCSFDQLRRHAVQLAGAAGKGPRSRRRGTASRSRPSVHACAGRAPAACIARPVLAAVRSCRRWFSAIAASVVLSEGSSMDVEPARVDVDRLREALIEEVGVAAFAGMPAAAVDLLAIESATPEELAGLAEQLGVDLRRFED